MTRYLLLFSLAGNLAAQATLDVTVYDWADTPRAVLEEAEAVVGRIFRRSGIEMRWRAASLESQEARLEVAVAPPRPDRPRQVECAARRDVAVSILPDSAAMKQGVLGRAEPLAPEGINVTVYLRRVLDAATQQGVSDGALLGHLLAHEMVHVLLRNAGHGSNGLMSGGWSAGQYDFIRRAALLFDRRQGRFMRATLTGERCSEDEVTEVSDTRGARTRSGGSPGPRNRP